MGGLDGVGVEYPAVVGVVRAAIAPLIGDADAHHVVGDGADAQPGFACGEAVHSGACTDGGCAGGIEGVPDADGRHGLAFSGRACLVQGLCDHGEGAAAANREAEPVALAHLAQATAPEPARRHRARRGLGSDGVLIAAGRRVGNGDGEGLRAARRHSWHRDGLQCAGGSHLTVDIGPDGVGEDVKRIDGLERDLIVRRGYAGGQRDSAQVEVALHGRIVRSPRGEEIAVRIRPPCDRIAVVSVEVAAGDEGDGVLIERIAIGVQGASDDVAPLHTVAGAEGDGAMNGDGVSRGKLLARKTGQVLGGDGIEAIEGGDVVVVED